MIRDVSEPHNRDCWRSIVRLTVVVILAVCLSAPSTAQQLTPTERAQIDSGALAVLDATGAPSASIAIVRGGEIVYERAFGDGRIDPRTPATPSMRYAIGSVSKQFTATAILLLEEEGKLSLHDKVAKWFPQLTRASDISVLQLLSMTSGYQDYWPQDYVFTDMQSPATAQMIMQRWGAKALDFDPGTKWQYSNTNYVIAAAIVERVAGVAFMDFLRQRILAPLKMTSVADFDVAALSESDAGACAVLTPAANAYFTQEVLSDYAASLAPLGSPTEFAASGELLRGGMTIRSYRIRAGGVLMELTTMTLPDGRIDQYIISRAG